MKILVLGYSPKKTKIFKFLRKYNRNLKISYLKKKTNYSVLKKFDLVISFGYRYIFKKKDLKKLNRPIINLHMSYLPYNKGSHPNFWSFFDNTPSGVTIHIVDGGVDTGPIVFQKYVNFTSKENTFSKTYEALFHELETLFKDNLHDLLSNNWTATKQKGAGSHHRTKDLPRNFSGWNADIKQELQKLDAEGIQN